ncbi:hypothetical protein HKD37_19G053468 [Glycine soja]
MAQNSVLKRVANIVLFPFSYLINSSSEGSRNPIADSSLQVLLVLIHYHKCLVSEGYSVLKNQVSASSDSLPKENTYFSNNPYCRALERATDCESTSQPRMLCPLEILGKGSKKVLGMICNGPTVIQASAFAHSPRDWVNPSNKVDCCSSDRGHCKITPSTLDHFDMNKVLEFGALLALGGQELDNTCHENNWVLPTYHLYHADGK